MSRELDEEVASKVMGAPICNAWRSLGKGHVKRGQCDHKNCSPHDEESSYSTDIKAALVAVRHAVCGHRYWTMQFTYSPHGVCCRITVPSSEYYGSGDTEPEAMSRAALDCVKKRRQDHGLDSDYPETKPLHERDGGLDEMQLLRY